MQNSWEYKTDLHSKARAIQNTKLLEGTGSESAQRSLSQGNHEEEELYYYCYYYCYYYA